MLSHMRASDLRRRPPVPKGAIELIGDASRVGGTVRVGKLWSD